MGLSKTSKNVLLAAGALLIPLGLVGVAMAKPKQPVTGAPAGSISLTVSKSDFSRQIDMKQMHAQMDFAIPNDVTVQITAVAQAGSPAPDMLIEIEMSVDQVNWVVVSQESILGVPLNVPQGSPVFFIPTDLLTLLGQEFGTFYVQARLTLSNIIDTVVLQTVAPLPFTLGQAPQGSIGITVT